MILYCAKCLDEREHGYVMKGFEFLAYCVPCGQLVEFSTLEEHIKKYKKEIQRNKDLLKKAKELSQ